MQAMLMAFITTNMSNSGIPSTKATPISRMFPPLFMIKISEEEKIASDTHIHCSSIVFHFSLYQEYCEHHKELIYL